MIRPRRCFPFAASMGSLAMVLIACGGSIASPGSSGSSASSGGSGSSSGGSSGGGDGSCTVEDVAGNRACVPGFAPPNTPLTIDVDATQGCLGCFATLEPCKVTVSGDRITVAMTSKVCPPPGDQACPTICQLPKTTCTIPPLTEGTYVVSVAGEPPPSFQERILVVSGDGKASASCALDAPGLPPNPVDATPFPKNCMSDDECVLVFAGDVCATPCGCENTAISKGTKAQFDALTRERASQCPRRDEKVACAPCAPRLAKCKTDGTSLTGTCIVAD